MLSESKIKTGTLYSKYLKLDWNYGIYFPKNFKYDENHPLLLMLHGIYGNYTNFFDEKRINSKPILDHLENKYHRQAVVVFIDGFNSFYINSTFCQQMQDAIIKELLPFLKSQIHFTYPISIGGISMGGYGSARLSLLYPDKFKQAILLSPALWQQQFYQPIFQTIHCFSNGQINWDPITYRTLFPTQYLNSQNQKVDFFIRSSLYDQVVAPKNVKTFIHALIQNGNDVHFEFDDFGAHNWDYWQKIIQPAYRYFYEQK